MNLLLNVTYLLDVSHTNDVSFIGILWWFRGQFLDGKRTGKGTAVMSNKCRYTGERSRISNQISLKISTSKDVEVN
jgi:hypothetical protein